MPRVERIMVMLAESAPREMTAAEIARELHDDPKAVYTALQDLKRRRNLVTGPVNGRWTISADGLANLVQRAKEAASG